MVKRAQSIVCVSDSASLQYSSECFKNVSVTPGNLENLCHVALSTCFYLLLLQQYCMETRIFSKASSPQENGQTFFFFEKLVGTVHHSLKSGDLCYHLVSPPTCSNDQFQKYCWFVENVAIAFPSSHRQKSQSEKIALGVIKLREQKQISKGNGLESEFSL